MGKTHKRKDDKRDIRVYLVKKIKEDLYPGFADTSIMDISLHLLVNLAKLQKSVSIRVTSVKIIQFSRSYSLHTVFPCCPSLLSCSPLYELLLICFVRTLRSVPRREFLPSNSSHVCHSNNPHWKWNSCIVPVPLTTFGHFLPPKFYFGYTNTF